MEKRGDIGALIILLLFVIVSIFSCGEPTPVKTAEQMIQEAKDKAMAKLQADTTKQDTIQ